MCTPVEEASESYEKLAARAYEAYISLSEAASSCKKAIAAHNAYIDSWQYPVEEKPSTSKTLLVSIPSNINSDGTFWCNIESSEFEDTYTVQHISNSLKNCNKVQWTETDQPFTGALFYYSQNRKLYLRCRLKSSSPKMIQHMDLGNTEEIPQNTHLFVVPKDNITMFPFKCIFCILPFVENVKLRYEEKWLFNDLTSHKVLKLKFVGQKMLKYNKLVNIVMLKSFDGVDIFNEISKFVRSLPSPSKDQVSKKVSESTKPENFNQEKKICKIDAETTPKKPPAGCSSQSPLHQEKVSKEAVSEVLKDSAIVEVTNTTESSSKIQEKEKDVKTTKHLKKVSSIKSHTSKSFENLNFSKAELLNIQSKCKSLTDISTNTLCEKVCEKVIKSMKEKKKVKKKKSDESKSIRSDIQDKEKTSTKDNSRKNSMKEQSQDEMAANLEELKNEVCESSSERYWVYDVPHSQREKIDPILPPLMNLYYQAGILNKIPWEEIELQNIEKILYSKANLRFYWLDLPMVKISMSLKSHSVNISDKCFESLLQNVHSSTQYFVIRQIKSRSDRYVVGIARLDTSKNIHDIKIRYDEKYRRKTANIPITYVCLSDNPKLPRKWKNSPAYGADQVDLQTAKAIILAYKTSLESRSCSPVFGNIFPWSRVPPLLKEEKCNQGEKNMNRRRRASFHAKSQEEAVSFNIESSECWDDDTEKENSPKKKEHCEAFNQISDMPPQNENQMPEKPVAASEVPELPKQPESTSDIPTPSPIQNAATPDIIPPSSVPASTSDLPLHPTATGQSTQSNHIETDVEKEMNLRRLAEVQAQLNLATRIYFEQQQQLQSKNNPLFDSTNIYHARILHTPMQRFPPPIRKNPNGKDGYIGEIWYPDISQASIPVVQPKFEDRKKQDHESNLKNMPNSNKPDLVSKNKSNSNMQSDLKAKHNVTSSHPICKVEPAPFDGTNLPKVTILQRPATVKSEVGKKDGDAIEKCDDHGVINVEENINNIISSSQEDDYLQDDAGSQDEGPHYLAPYNISSSDEN